MPTVEDHKEIALAALKMFAQPDSVPQLDDPELNAILDGAQRASFWTLTTAFTFGAVVLPATKNGHRYVCSQGGTTAATEPTWPTRDGATVSDGTVIWREAGADYENVFDIRAASQNAWLAKKAKASELFDAGDQKLSQIAEVCEQMAESFEPIKFA